MPLRLQIFKRLIPIKLRNIQTTKDIFLIAHAIEKSIK